MVADGIVSITDRLTGREQRREVTRAVIDERPHVSDAVTRGEFSQALALFMLGVSLSARVWPIGAPRFLEQISAHWGSPEILGALALVVGGVQLIGIALLRGFKIAPPHFYEIRLTALAFGASLLLWFAYLWIRAAGAFGSTVTLLMAWEALAAFSYVVRQNTKAATTLRQITKHLNDAASAAKR